MDRKWWDVYGAQATQQFAGKRCAPVRTRFADRVQIDRCGNSGAGAMVVAVQKFGARRLLLLGFDCQHTGGRTHWHGNHVAGLGNAGVVSTWPDQFQKIQRHLRGIEVVNCSRQTALHCFPRAALEACI